MAEDGRGIERVGLNNGLGNTDTGTALPSWCDQGSSLSDTNHEVGNHNIYCGGRKLPRLKLMDGVRSIFASKERMM